MTDFNTLTPDQVLSERNKPGVKLVDVRSSDEYFQQHIPGSILIPLHEFAAKYQEELSPEDEIIVYCQHGVRSARAANYLAGQGYANVSHLAGGIVAWEGPVEPE